MIRIGLALPCLALMSPASWAQSSIPIYPEVMSYLGGSGDGERIQDVHVGADKRVYVCGNTDSKDFSSQPWASGKPGHTHAHGSQVPGDSDGFAAILTKDLSAVEAWTYLGGTFGDRAYSIRTDGSGNVFIYGFTSSNDFTGAAGQLSGTRDTFLVKFELNSSGVQDLTNLLWSKLFGGDDNCCNGPCAGAELEQGRTSLYVDYQGNSLISGGTNCPDFPGHGWAGTPIQAKSGPVDGNFDAFLTKIDPSGSVIWSTFLGTPYDESAYSGVEVHGDGTIYVAGACDGPGLAVHNTPGKQPYQPNYGGGAGVALHANPIGDGFVARFRPNGQLIWCTYLGGSDNDQVSGNSAIALDGSGNAWVLGFTKSADFPIPAGTSPFQPTHADLTAGWSTPQTHDGFIAVISADGTTLEASTYVGGGTALSGGPLAIEELSGIELDGYGNVFFTGNTYAVDTANPCVYPPPAYIGWPITCTSYQMQNYVLETAVFAKASADLSQLLYSTHLGGFGAGNPANNPPNERGRAVARLNRNIVFVAGDTESSDLIPSPTTPGFQASLAGQLCDGFIARFRFQ